MKNATLPVKHVTPTYQFEIRPGGDFDFFTADGSLPYVESRGPAFVPLTTRAAIWGTPEVELIEEGACPTYALRYPSNSLYENPRTILKLHPGYVEMFFKADRVKARVALQKWYLLAAGSRINAIECLSYRSHIDSHLPYEIHQTILGRRKLGAVGLNATTEDGDLMFGPHPMLFVFRHLEHNLTIAPMSLVQAESMTIQMRIGETTITDFSVRVGDNLYWIEEGEALESPHFMIVATNGESPDGTLARYTGLLVEEGIVEKKDYTNAPDWWFSPMWCSWGDQHTDLDTGESIHRASTGDIRRKVLDNINERMVNNAVEMIEKHDLPIRTLILDDQWYTKQGDMKVDVKKFPDMRGLVDRLKTRGYRVMAWTSLYQYDRQSEVFQKHPEWFIVFNYGRNYHNKYDKDLVFIDYSNPEIAEAYLRELLGRLLSDAPGAYNFDGIKFDWPFLLPHDYPFADRSWVGKEMTVYKTQKLIYDIAHEIKKDALIMGVSPHPFFQDTQDMIRTYDITSFDPSIQLDRARYIQAIAPGMAPCLDEHNYHTNFFRYIDEGVDLGGIPMVYTMLYFNADNHKYTDADYAALKQSLDRYVARTPRFAKYLQQLPALKNK